MIFASGYTCTPHDHREKGEDEALHELGHGRH